MATGDWCALLDHDDRLYPNALFEFVRFMNLHPNAEVFFSDEIVVREDGQALGQPFFKPAWSPILNLQVNYCAHLCAYKTDLIRRIGGFRVGFEGSQDHDLIMRASESAAEPPVHIPFCVYQWRVHPQSTASSITAKPYAAGNGHLQPPYFSLRFKVCDPRLSKNLDHHSHAQPIALAARLRGFDLYKIHVAKL